MNDREFIELLNLYVDHEISTEDALRLEAEVGARPERRKVYDQYCRIQKACTMLSGQLAESAAAVPEREAIEFPAPRTWRLAPVLAGLAAAACIIAVVGLRNRGAVPVKGAPGVAAMESGASLAIPEPVVADPMKPVFSTRVAGHQPDRSVTGPMFAMDSTTPQIAPLNWIGDIHMAPVFSAANNPDFLLAPKPDLKAPISGEAQGGRDSQEPLEMTAFRFQR
jgi:hypothetical protein